MNGKTLYEKAQNGGMGFPPWEKLPAGQKGLWNNAAREVSYEKEKVLGRGHRAELKRTVAFIRNKCATLRGDPALGLSDMMIGMLAFGEDLARMLERGEHT